MIIPQFLSFGARGRRAWLYLAISTLLLSFLLAACSDTSSSSGGHSTSGLTSSPASTQVALTQLHWCGKPVMLFRDEGAPPTATPTTANTPVATATRTAKGTPTTTATPAVAGTPKTLTDWSQVEPDLGFTVYLPVTLPQNSCLVSALGTIHDPIFGGSFTIGYLLPDHSSLSLAEAPLRAQGTQFQCNLSTTSTTSSIGSVGALAITMIDDASFNSLTSPPASPTPTQTPEQICSGAMNTTNIIFSARGSTDSLQKFFNALQPNVNWIPAS